MHTGIPHNLWSKTWSEIYCNVTIKEHHSVVTIAFCDESSHKLRFLSSRSPPLALWLKTSYEDNQAPLDGMFAVVRQGGETIREYLSFERMDSTTCSITTHGETMQIECWCLWCWFTLPKFRIWWNNVIMPYECELVCLIIGITILSNWLGFATQRIGRARCSAPVKLSVLISGVTTRWTRLRKATSVVPTEAGHLINKRHWSVAFKRTTRNQLSTAQRSTVICRWKKTTSWITEAIASVTATCFGISYHAFSSWQGQLHGERSF